MLASVNDRCCAALPVILCCLCVRRSVLARILASKNALFNSHGLRAVIHMLLSDVMLCAVGAVLALHCCVQSCAGPHP